MDFSSLLRHHVKVPEFTPEQLAYLDLVAFNMFLLTAIAGFTVLVLMWTFKKRGWFNA